MTRRLTLTMIGIVAGTGVILFLLLRPTPRADTPPPTIRPAATAPVVAASDTSLATNATATPAGQRVSATTPTPGSSPAGPAPLPPGVKLQAGYATGKPVPPEPILKMPLEQRLEKATQMAGVLEKEATTLDREIAAAEAAGKKDEALHKRVLAQRLRARVVELRTAVATKQAPQ